MMRMSFINFVNPRYHHNLGLDFLSCRKLLFGGYTKLCFSSMRVQR